MEVTLHGGRVGHKNVEREEAEAWSEKGLFGEEG